MELKYLPRFFQYKDNHFINIDLIEVIEPARCESDNMWYWVNGHVYSVPREAHERLMQIYKSAIEYEEE